LRGSSIRIENIGKQFGTCTALDNVSFTINNGEFFSLLGPSGCGKTTLLRIIAGFESPSNGALFIDDVNALSIPPNRRATNTIFQNYALFPHLSVYENVAFSQRLKKVPKSELDRKVNEFLDLVKLVSEKDRFPAQLSGGQKQRVAIARALINQPKILLLDEPLSALDAKLRQRMLIELDAIHDKVGITFIYVTHDQQEALSVSDRVAVLDGGVIRQIGTPVEIYEHPADAFVANFIGETNYITGTVRQVLDADHILVEVEHLGAISAKTKNDVAVGSSVSITLRPERIDISAEVPRQQSGHVNVLKGNVDEIIYSGFQSRYFVKCGGMIIKAHRQHATNNRAEETPIRWNENAYICWRADDGYIVEAVRQ